MNNCSHSSAPFSTLLFTKNTSQILDLVKTVTAHLSSKPNDLHLCSIAKQLLVSPDIITLSSELVSSGVELFLHSKTKKLGASFLVTAMLLESIPSTSESFFQSLVASSEIRKKSRWGSCIVEREKDASEIMKGWGREAIKVLHSDLGFRRACRGRVECECLEENLAESCRKESSQSARGVLFFTTV